MIGHVYGHWVTNSYDEVKTFRISAAFWADQSLLLKFKSKGGLIQGISHNFDANLYTQNGLRQTHALASIICQPSSPDDDKMKREDIPRLQKQQLSKVQLSDMEIKTFAGEKKPKMPASLAKFGVSPHKVLCYWIAIQKWANEEDFLFLKYRVIVSSTQEFSGYNTRTTRETGQSLKAKWNVYYRPLINKTPVDPSTMLTLFRMGGIGGGAKRGRQKGPPTSFSHVTSRNVGFGPENFLTLVLTLLSL